MNETFQQFKEKFGGSYLADYIPLLVTYTREDAEINGLRKAKKTDTVDRIPEYFSALEALDRSKKIVLVGERGMGKSTFLKMLALCMAGEEAGDKEFNLAKLTEPVFRSETAETAEKQVWNAGLLKAVWFYLPDCPDGHLPDGLEDAGLILIDGIESVSGSVWEQARNEINALCAGNPDLYAAAVCEADVLNRLRPRLQGFTGYTVKSLIGPQKRQFINSVCGPENAGKTAAMAAAVPSAMKEILDITQNYMVWVRSGCAAQTTSGFFGQLLAEAPEYAGRKAWDFLTGNVQDGAVLPTIRDFGWNDSLIKYSAVQYCLENDFSDRFGALIDNLQYESRSALRMLERIISESDTAGFLDKIMKLCPDHEPCDGDEPDALRALYSAELAFSVRDRFAGNDAYLCLLQKWMKAIVCNAWLSVYDRIEAAKKLSWLGDDRDLQALAEVPAGSFRMGDYLIANNQPVAEVRVDAFKMGVYPVTNAFYAEFIRETGTPWLSNEAENCERKNYPAVNLTWYEAVKFCDWLTEKWRAEGRIADMEFVRLPTEAEWEYAARGKRGAEPGQMIFAWPGGWTDDNANSAELGLNDTCAVGLFPGNVSDFGIRDMNGMIWEWNTTNWGPEPKKPDYPYPYDASDGRENSRHAADEVRRVMRGGSFGSTADHATATYRGHLEPIGFWRGDGFRIVVSETAHE